MQAEIKRGEYFIEYSMLSLYQKSPVHILQQKKNVIKRTPVTGVFSIACSLEEFNLIISVKLESKL